VTEVPEIRIVRGMPTDEELAAIVGVLLARRTAPSALEQPPTSRWARCARPGALPGWRGCAMPR
jgi:hypothetical protein